MVMKTVSIISIKSIKNNLITTTYAIDLLQGNVNALGYDVLKVTLVEDNINLVAFEIKSLIKQYDIVLIVSENLCPAYKALGKILGEELQFKDELATVLKQFDNFNNETALLPSSVNVLSKENLYPIVYFQRIFVLNLNHIDKCFTKILKPCLVKYREEPVFQKGYKLITNGNTNSLAKVLPSLEKLLKVEIEIDKKQDNFWIILVKSIHWDKLIEFQDVLIKQFNVSDSWIVLNNELIYSEANETVKKSLKHIETCLSTYGRDNVFIAFNGGKDCTVLLHLFLVVLNKNYPNFNKPITCLYIQSENPFPEQDKFISNCQKFYNLNVITLNLNIKDSLMEILNKYPNFKACLMGTRRTDPYSANLNIFQLTDPDWPQIMRVSPLLDWHYCEIWDYLLYFKVPYCLLYDLGYTSLGSVNNTVKNSSLIYWDIIEDREVYLPAYKLLDEKDERNGRNER